MSNSNLFKASDHGLVPVDFGANHIAVYPVIVIYEGRPYQLVREKKVTENNPCRLCDLLSKCTVNGFLSSLCQTDDRNSAWFFMEDWEIANKTIMDFLSRIDV